MALQCHAPRCTANLALMNYALDGQKQPGRRKLLSVTTKNGSIEVTKVKAAAG
jgi:hypothetical protein